MNLLFKKKKHSAPRNAIITSQRGVISNFLCRVLLNFLLFIYFVTGEQISRDLQKYLSTRFDKVSVDSDLQQTIRENLYNRTVPCKFYLSSQVFTRLSSLWTLKLWCFFFVCNSWNISFSLCREGCPLLVLKVYCQNTNCVKFSDST